MSKKDASLSIHSFTHPPTHPLFQKQVDVIDPGRTDKAWLLRETKKWVPSPSFRVHVPGRQYEEKEVCSVKCVSSTHPPTPYL